MSYFADHLAWQQRVAQEFKASSQFNEAQMQIPAASETGGMEYFRYPDLVNYLLKSTDEQVDTPVNPMPQTMSNTSKGMHGAFNTGSYDYRPKPSILLRAKSSGGSRRALRSFTGAPSQQSAVKIRSSVPSQTLSQYSQKRSIFTPSHASQQAGPRKRERFNENLDKESVRSLAQSTRSLTAVNLQAASQRAQSAGGSQRSASQKKSGVSFVSTHSKFNQQRYTQAGKDSKTSEMSRKRRRDLHTKRIMDVVAKLDEQELEKVSELLKASEPEEQDEQQNDFAQQEEIDQAEPDQMDASDGGDEEEEAEDEVASLPIEIAPSQKSGYSRSSASQKAISNLYLQLNEERDARIELETTLKALKANSLEMVKQLNAQ